MLVKNLLSAGNPDSWAHRRPVKGTGTRVVKTAALQGLGLHGKVCSYLSLIVAGTRDYAYGSSRIHCVLHGNRIILPCLQCGFSKLYHRLYHRGFSGINRILTAAYKRCVQ